jgi:hypothetical protein
MLLLLHKVSSEAWAMSGRWLRNKTVTSSRPSRNPHMRELS